MYLVLDVKNASVPQITLKKNNSNVIKKEDIKIYDDARSLLSGLEELVAQYESSLEQQVEEIIKEKEKELNEYLEDLCREQQILYDAQNAKLVEKAEQAFMSLLQSQEEYLDGFWRDLKRSTTLAIQERLDKFCNQEKLINYLTDLLHTEIDDEAKKLKVERKCDGQGVALTIEDDDRIVSVNTKTLIQELQGILDKL
ncbi:hypothetical protein [Citrobacter portucalensis]|uniref:hypothetical protein n=1 Tax=Citrobacter portucalensis TaxID=1639133 RepID=UPI00226B7B99|nr:hypothetical protein [Citrobacter portucalensis]MCX8985956.1 hypothetical protein [Citrobacter portucalensis]